MKNLKRFHSATFDSKFVYQNNNKELQLLVRVEGHNGDMTNANIEANISEGLLKIAKHNGELWNKFIKKFSEKAKMAKKDLTEVSLTTEQNREGKYSLLFKMGERGHKILQLLGDNLENAIENYIEDREYKLKELKVKIAPPPPTEGEEPSSGGAPAGEAKPEGGEAKPEGDKQEEPKADSKEAPKEKGEEEKQQQAK